MINDEQDEKKYYSKDEIKNYCVDRLINLFESRHESTMDWAELLGVSSTQIRKYLNGIDQLPVHAIYNICIKCDLSPSYFFPKMTQHSSLIKYFNDRLLSLESKDIESLLKIMNLMISELVEQDNKLIEHNKVTI